MCGLSVDQERGSTAPTETQLLHRQVEPALRKILNPKLSLILQRELYGEKKC